MKLLTGGSGFIGKSILELSTQKFLAPTHRELDLTDKQAVDSYIKAVKPELIIHCASNDKDICLYDNLRMFYNLAEHNIPMITFCTGREIEDRSYRNGEYVLSKHISKELALNKYKHISVIQIWGCFGKYEKDIRFFMNNMKRVKQGLSIRVDEDRLFSYVWVNDLVKIVDTLSSNILNIGGSWHKGVVAYTSSFKAYAETLKKITKSKKIIKFLGESFNHSYVGYDNCIFNYTPLEEALTQMWKEVKQL